MKKVIVTLAIALAAFAGVAKGQDKGFTVEGKTYKSTKVAASHGRQDTTVTAYTYEVRGTEYPIVLSKNGSAFVGRTSKKTGKYYRQYLGEEISRDICQKLGREYKGKTNNK